MSSTTNAERASALLLDAIKRLADVALTAGVPRSAPAFQNAIDAIDWTEKHVFVSAGSDDFAAKVRGLRRDAFLKDLEDEGFDPF